MSNLPTPQLELRPVSTVVVCGEMGVGKSSVINLLARHNVAPTLAPTTHAECYYLKWDEFTCMLIDTPGIDCSEHPNLNTVTTPDTEALSTVIREFKARSAVNLLILFCMRGSRITGFSKSVYDACASHGVPIAAVVTHQEHAEKMDAWWKENQQALDQRGMKFIGHACITTLKDRDERYQISRSAVRELICNSFQVSASLDLIQDSG